MVLAVLQMRKCNLGRNWKETGRSVTWTCCSNVALKELLSTMDRETPVRWQVLREGIRGQTDRNHNHRKLTNLITWTTALSNSVKLSHAVWGHPRWMGHGGEVWQNVVHWRREWQTVSVFLPWEPQEQYDKQKDRTLKDELLRSVGAQYGDQWRNNSRKNEGMEPKQRQHKAVGLVIKARFDAVESNIA